MGQLIKYNRSKNKLIVGFLAIFAMVFLVGLVLLLRTSRAVNTFEQCRKAGGAMLETYPEQCIINKKTFTNSAQSMNDDSYIGMAEDEALAKAEMLQVPARVVERDGESLPRTMDFVPGRLNFFVKNAQIHSVEIEGEVVENR